jgi:hypothetical protein
MSMSANVTAATSVMVPLARIPTDEGAQTRVQVRAAVVRDYAAAMKEQLAEGGLRFPPVIVFNDGANYWLGDGFHRVLAALKAGMTEIAAEVRPGTQRDAVLFAISANNAHGLPRSRADVRKAIAMLLADAEWSQWGDREIGRRCQVEHKFVTRMRRRASGAMPQIEKRKVRRGGTVYEMNVRPKVAAAEAPPAPATTDGLGIPLHEQRVTVFAAADDFRAAQELFDRLGSLLDRIAQSPSGDLYRQDMIRTANNTFACAAFRLCRDKLLGAEPYCSYCPNCHPTHPLRPYPACKKCGGRGWTTRAAFESCGVSDRQQILKMRVVNGGRSEEKD